MRPVALQISGLNSFRKPVAIDFDKLLKDGLFGIFGPTGSGKSTILDAITLALYGKVRRAPGGTQGIINMGEQRCSVSFSFFIGDESSRRRCTVERLLARNSKSGGVETKKARLAVYRDGVLEQVGEKSNELKDMVNDIVGINVEDFLRAVVLPQGAFADFLTLEAKERSIVLQRLFGLYQLGDHLNQLLKQHAQELQEAHSHIQGRLQDLRAYDDEALALCHDVLREAEARRAEAREALKRIEARHAEAATLAGQIAEYHALIESEERRRADGERLGALRARIELAERSIAVAPAVAALAAARARFAEADERYNQAVREKESVAGRLEITSALYARAEALHKERFVSLCDEINELKLVKQGKDELRLKHERLRGVRDELRSISEKFERQSKLRDEGSAVIVSHEEEIAKLERQIAERTVSADERRLLSELQLSIQRQIRLRGEIETSDRDLAAVRADIESTERALASAIGDEHAKVADAGAVREALAALKLRLASHATEREELLAQHGRYKETLSSVDQLEKNRLEYERELREHNVKLMGSRKMLEEAATLLKEAQSHECVAIDERGSIMQLRDEAHRRLALASLAEHLLDGVPCPLCGAVEHLAPFHAESAASVELESIDKELARIERKVRETEERRRQIEHSLARSESALEHLELDAEERERKVASARDGVDAALKSIDVEPRVESVDDLRGRIEAVTASGLAIKRSIEEGTRMVAAQEERVAVAEESRGRIAEQRVRLEAALTARRGRSEELDRALIDLRRQLSDEGERFADRAGGRTLAAAEEALRQMAENDSRIESIRADAAQQQKGLQSAKARLIELEPMLKEIEKRKDEMEGERRNLETDCTAIAERLSGRLSELVPESERDENIEQLIERREESRDRIQREYDDAKNRYDADNADAHVARERVDAGRNARGREEKERDEADAACRALLATNGFDSTADAESGMLAPDQLKMRREEVRSIEEEIDRARRRMIELEERIAGRTINDAEMAELDTQLHDTRGMDEESIRNLGAAQEKLRECREKNAEWKSVSDQSSLSAEERSIADQLAKYLRGNGFVDFLANERLAEICRRASMQLGVLTAGRFELDARMKEGFIIRDNGNGGGERSPSSLSGGETFLVSLSLAIALSDTIQLGHAPLEFFFLDEGFGTLDSDLLETVMNTLDRLRSRHRAIGVISHVAQLRERISRRLIVTPANDVEGSTVRYEAA